MSKTTNEKDFLFPLRQRRDELAEIIQQEIEDDEYQTEKSRAIESVMNGDIKRFSDAFPRPFRSESIEHLYDVCVEIKEREARLYSEAMKGAR